MASVWLHRGFDLHIVANVASLCRVYMPLHVASMWLPSNSHKVSKWLPCGFHIASMWLPRSFSPDMYPLCVASMWLHKVPERLPIWLPLIAQYELAGC